MGEDRFGCAGDTLKLVPNLSIDTFNYLWSTGDTTTDLNVYKSGCYSLTVTYDSCEIIDTVNIELIENPEANFLVSDVCENQSLIILNQSSKIDSNSSLNIFIGNQFINLNGDGITDTIDLQIFSPDQYLIDLTLTNGGICLDTQSLKAEVFPLSDVEFTGLDNTYCSSGLQDTLKGFPVGGIFSGTNVNNQNSLGILTPTVVGENLSIIYQITDENGCNSSISQTYQVFRTPDLRISNLEIQYCLGDSIVTFYSNITGGIFDGEGIIDLEPNDSIAMFDPNVEGDYIFSYSFTSLDGCSNSISKITRVFGIPEFSLGEDISIEDGQEVELAPGIINVDDFEFEWSNGKTTDKIIVFNPGEYILNVTDKESQCTVSDSINVFLISSTEEVTMRLSQISMKVTPNPIWDYFQIEFNNIYKIKMIPIRIYNTLGQLVFREDFKCQQGKNEIRISTEGWIEGIYYLSTDLPDKKILFKN